MPESDVEATATQERFYYADGQKIPLSPSRRYVAVRPSGQRAAAGLGAPALRESLASIASPGNVFDLPELDITVIKLDAPPEGPSPVGASIDPVRSVVGARSDIEAGPAVYEAAEAPSAEEGLIVTNQIIVKFLPGSGAEARRKLLKSAGGKVEQEDYPEPDAYLVVVAEDHDPIATANELHENELVDYAQPNFVRLTPRLDGSANGGPGRVAVMESDRGAPIEADSMATMVEPGAQAEVVGPSATPTDPGFASQWGLKKIKGPEAFDISMGSAAISVAVLDEGVNLSHEDLSFKLPGYDAVTRTDNPEPKPADGHGTSCAGIVAAIANNGRGGVGVAPNAKILPVRIAYGAGGGWVTSDAIIADAIRTAVNRGADVLSNSWGGGAPSTAITNAFRFGQTNGRGGKGTPIAVATGNQDVRGVSYPANLSPTVPGLLAVGASNEWDQRKSKTSLDGENWWGSNYGPEVDVVAPGVHIYATDIMGAAGYGAGNYIPNFNGTSSATPHVAGLMALVLSVDPDLRSFEVEDIIKLTADELGAPGRDEHFGFGRINARRALEAASRLWYEIQVVPQFIGTGRECFMRIRARIYNPGINTIRLDSLTLTSHSPSWSSEIDRFEYRPNPGNVLAPRSGQDVRLNNVLLKANGNASSWNYRWSINWAYTYWRPGGSILPLAGEAPLAEAEGRKLTGSRRGGADKPAPAGGGVPGVSVASAALDESASSGDGLAGDQIAIDRTTRTITITIR
jgi:subtilisin family serine protease